MYVSTLNFKENPSKWIAITAIFAGLYVLGYFIAIPGVSSLGESIITWICAGLFGPWIAVIACILGEGISMFIKAPDLPIFIPSTLISVVLMALIMGYGRRLALPKSTGTDRRRSRKIRMITESILYIVMLVVKYTFYTLWDIAFFVPSFAVTILLAFVVKCVLLPIGLIIIEAVRKGLDRVYFDLELAEIAPNKVED